jgi:hypothetical protein
VPAVVTVSVLPDTWQLVAVPSIATNDRVPVPLPPLVVRVSGEFTVPLNEVMLRGAWVASPTVTKIWLATELVYAVVSVGVKVASTVNDATEEGV